MKKEKDLVLPKSFDLFLKNFINKIHSDFKMKKTPLSTSDILINILKNSDVIFNKELLEIFPSKKQKSIIKKLDKLPKTKLNLELWKKIVKETRKISSFEFKSEVKINHLLIVILKYIPKIASTLKSEKINLQNLTDYLLDSHCLNPRIEGWKDTNKKAPKLIKTKKKEHSKTAEISHQISIKKNLLELQKRLKKKILNQKSVIDSVIKTLFLKKLGLELNQETPAGIFMFIGQRGVGKTEFTKTLAEEYFGQKSNLIKIDIEDFKGEMDLFKLFGPLMGHVGTQEAGILTETILQNPKQIILLKSIEKMPKSLMNLLIQIFGDGYIISKHGERIYFSETVFIMTSNTKALVEKVKKIGFNSKKDVEISQEFLSDVLKEFFPIDFLNKIDKIIFFNPMTKKTFRDILKYKIKLVTEKLKQEKKKLIVKDNVLKFLVKNKFKQEFGARGTDKIIETYILLPIVDFILNNPDTNVLKLDIKDGQIKVK
ncbi:ATP-dependent Clp protease ATP-binding subunit [Candidatus Dependentiae bacterium]|nr:ATP-dependent Clp protease ATP-binding subunit [Candidatus Dependentiae bacterium]